MASSIFRYRAFLSYSHDDMATARLLHRKLEAYRLPAKFVGRITPAGVVPNRIRPIYRDEDESPASSNLSAQILGALRDSAYLIVICSPSAAKSEWVNEEIRVFKAMGRSDRILCVIASGEPSASRRDEALQTCYPPALLREQELEVIERPGEASRTHDSLVGPSAPDLRPGASRRLALLKVVSGLVGLGLDDLKQRDLERRNRMLMVFGLAATVMSAGLTWLTLDWKKAQIDAKQQAEVAFAASKRLVARRIAEQSREILQGSPVSSATQGWLLAVLAHRLSSDSASVAALQSAAMQARQQSTYFRVEGEVRTLEFSHDGKLVAVGFSREPSQGATLASRDTYFVQLWRTLDGSPIGPPISMRSCESPMRFSSNGRRLVCNHGDTISVLEILESEVQLKSSSFSKHHRGAQIADLSFSPTGGQVTTVLTDGTLQDWDTEKLEPIGDAYRLAGGRVYRLAHSRNGQRMLAAFEGGSVREFDPVAHRALGPARAADARVRTLDYSSRDGRPFIALTNGQSTRWESGPAKTSDVWTVPITDDWPNWRDSSDGSFRVAWGQSRVVRIWRRGVQENWFQPLVQDGSVGAVALDDKGHLVAIGATDGSVRLWNSLQTEPLVTWRLSRKKEVTSLAVHKDWLAISQIDGKVEIFDWKRQELVGTFMSEPPDPVIRIAFVEQGSWLVTQEFGGALKWWNVHTRKSAPAPADAESMLKAIHWPSASDEQGAPGPRRPIAMAPTGNLSVTTLTGRDVRFLDPTNNLVDKRTASGHEQDILALSFDPDGRRLASGSEDGTVRLWDVATRTAIGLPLRHGGEVAALAFSANGRYLFSASHDKFVRQWDIDSNAWEKEICARVSRDLTREEWRASVGEILPFSPTCAK